MARALFLAFLFLALPAQAQAQLREVSPQDARAIRAVVTDQLDAFARDDGPRAFELAAAGIRAQFGSHDVFMHMVRTAYPVVYRPKRVQFEKPELVEGAIIQPVLMTDDAGRTWLALYPMLREEGARWRINGCQLARVSRREA
jgi:hypothetical protein